MTFVRLGAHLHHVRIDGPDAGETVIFANSLGTDLRIWDEVVARLPPSVRAVRYDMRGHGLTPPSEPPYSIAQLAHDLEALIDWLEAPRVTICGISVGGQVALQSAHDRPRQVQGLVLCDTSYRVGTREMWNQRIATVAEQGLAAISDLVVSRWFSNAFRSAKPDDVEGYRCMLERCSVAGYTGVCAALRDSDLEAVARALRCRTLVLCGDEDQATPPDLNRALAAAVPGARYESIPGAGHLPCLERPEIVSSHLCAFVESHAHV